MENGLIIVKQLPVIEDQLAAVKEAITQRVNEALSLVCTEETCKQVKKVRADLNKEYTELETRRKEVKAAVLAPYEKFEAVYKDCAGDIYKDADLKLKQKIAEVENSLKQQKITALCDYFVEYRTSLDLPEDLVKYDDMGIRVGLSDSLTSLKKLARLFLDHIADDLKAINGNDDRDEVMAEYRQNGFNLANALSSVAAHHKAIENAKRAREEAEARRKALEDKEKEITAAAASQEPIVPHVSAPATVEIVQSIPNPDAVPEASEDEEIMLQFKVWGTLEKLRAVKKFLDEGGYRYE